MPMNIAISPNTCDNIPICCVGMTRWVDERTSHELYNAGHLFEAAVAHYQATGKRNLLDVATNQFNQRGDLIRPDAIECNIRITC